MSDTPRSLHMIGNAHMDPVWIWDWREGFGEVWATFGSALDRLDEHPDVVFTASSAAHHAWIEQHDPAMFDRIRAAVAGGRWCIVGGMWIEPDCNLPSGESFCRQLLAGQRFFHRAFGRTARVGYNIDSFGHNAGLPQLLARSGLDSYVMMRPDESERTLPAHAFRWADASGTSVIAYRIPFEYSTRKAEHLEGRVADGSSLAVAEGTPMMLFYGIGNHGGGPTRQMIAEIDRLAGTQPQVCFSDPERYFTDVQAGSGTLPLVVGELQHHAVGCYSVSAWVKAANDRCEAALLDAEALEMLASRLAGRPYAHEELAAAWEELLLCQFHDVIAGTSSAAAYETIRSRFGYVGAIADRVTTNAAYEIAHRVDTAGGSSELVERRSSFWTGREGQGVPYLVLNPLAWPVRQAVVAKRPSGRVVDSSGAEVACQQIASGEVTLFGSHSLFVADLPALGYEVFWLQGGERVPGPVQAPAGFSLAEPCIESDCLRAAVDPRTGAVSSIVELATGRELIGEGGIRPVVLADASDTWSHGSRGYEGAGEPGEFAGAELIEAGPVRWMLRLRFGFGGSSVVEDLSLTAGSPFAELRIRADWSSARTVLKLVLPWKMGPAMRTVAGAAYSHAERDPAGGEEPMIGWLDCYDPESDSGVACTTDHLHGYDASPSVLRLTVLRNPVAADHGGGWATGVSEDYPFTDSGSHDAAIRIHSHAGDWRTAGFAARAAEQAHPPIVVADTYHSGELPPRAGALVVDPPQRCLVRAVKSAEGGDGLVLRLVEAAGEPVTVRLSGDLLGREIQTELAPFEVQTLLVPDDRSAPARVVPITELE